jgi:FSR family fosmidomycin resistance protein-like MFS transporter
MTDSAKSAILVAPTLVEPAERVRPHAKLIALLALGHFVVDLNQGAIPAMLPFLRDAHGITYAQAAAIVLVANLTSSLIQPLFGYLTDQIARRWILPVAVTFSGAGLALTGVAPGYGVVLLLVLVMGLGVAAWHPEGYKTATSVAGDRKATALSWFSLGGNVGIALGPLVLAHLVVGFGRAGSLAMLLPSLVVAALILSLLPRINRAAAPRAALTAAGRGVNMPGAMALLIALVAVRSWAHLGFTTFVPFYYVDRLGADPRLVGPLLFVFLGGGAIGTVMAGPLADRWGARVFVRWALLAAVPFGLLFLASRGVLAWALLGVFGAVLTSSFTVSVVLGQAYLPRMAGTASGLIVGFAIGAGGLGVAGLGWVADQWGLRTALLASALMPAAAFVLARFLPAPRDRDPGGR